MEYLIVPAYKSDLSIQQVQQIQKSPGNANKKLTDQQDCLQNAIASNKHVNL